MDRPLIWVWGTFVALGFGTFAVNGSVTAGVVVGVAAGACVWLATASISSHWQTLAAAFSRAARGLPVTLADDPGELREVQAAAVAHSETAQKLALLRAALDTMPGGFWVTRGDGTLLEHNLTAKTLLRLPGGAIGHHPREFLSDATLLGAVDAACHAQKSSSLTLALAGMSALLRVHVTPLPQGRGSSAVFVPVSPER